MAGIHPVPRRKTKGECLAACAHVILMAVIRIEQERLDAEADAEARGGAS